MANRFGVGERVGVPWLGGTDGTCRNCRRGAENLCLAPVFTGWDVNEIRRKAGVGAQKIGDAGRRLFGWLSN